MTDKPKVDPLIVNVARISSPSRFFPDYYFCATAC